MSDSNPEVNIKPKVKKTTPVSDTIDISEAHAQLVSDFVNSPVYRILKKVVLPQHLDKIAREALAESPNYEQVMFFRGRTREVKAMFQMFEKIRTEYSKQNTTKQDKQFKK